MSLEEKVSLTISIAKSYRDRLRTMAAEQNLHDPDQITSASTIAREIVCEYIDKIDSMRAGFRDIALNDDLQKNVEPDASPEPKSENLDAKRDKPCRTTMS